MNVGVVCSVGKLEGFGVGFAVGFVEGDGDGRRLDVLGAVVRVGTKVRVG